MERMKLLNDYIFDNHLRYQEHQLIFTGDKQPVMFRGFWAASVVAALLSISEEGEIRDINIDSDEGRKDFFRRYEKEVLADNGGLFNTEVQALSDAYLECADDADLLLRICRNERLLDLALGLTIEYMQHLVKELVCDFIYELHPWHEPFAQWLFDAAFIETKRQQLLNINWTDPAEVFALTEEMNSLQSASYNLQSEEPTFVFNGLSAEQILNGYWNWLSNTAKKEADLFPDSKVHMAQIKKAILENERDYDFLKPEMKDFTPEQLNIFRAWMNQWTALLEQKIQSDTPKKNDIRQELFLDDVLNIPKERNYVEVRTYILERCKYDPDFKNYYRVHKMTDFCLQLSLLFNWYVDPNALGKRMKSKSKK